MRARLFVVAFVAAAAALAVGSTYAAFNSTTANGSNSFGAKRIFPRNWSLAAMDLRDASSGAEANKSDPLSYGGDSLTTSSSGNVASGSNAYFEFTLGSQLPGGLSVSSVTFKFSLASAGGAGSGNGCFWFDVRSGGSVIGTHGSYASAVGCSTTTTLKEFDTTLSEVTTTDQMNGLVIRAYAWDTGGKKVKVDLATVTGSTSYGTFTSYERQVVDSSGALTTPWKLASVDATVFTSASAWPTSAATTKYLKLTFDPGVPTGAVISSATLTFVYKASAATSGAGLCYYVDVFQGTTLLATHGSGSSAYSCNTSSTNYVTSTVSLTEVDSAAKADALDVKIYMWSATSVTSNVDQGQLTLNYYLN
jgi:predicted ribosomally synthesized peptide with SipW-like signal peptide